MASEANNAILEQELNILNSRNFQRDKNKTFPFV